MGTRRRNRPVSTAVANRPRTLDTGLPGAHSARPRARDPPSPVPRELPELPTGRERAMANPPREDLPGTHGQKGRGDAGTSPLLNAGLAKLVQLQLATLPVDPLAAYPLIPAIWKVRTTGTGRQPGIPRVSAIRYASSTANPSGATHACSA